MKKALVLVVILAVAAGVYWRDRVMEVAGPYTTRILSVAGFAPKAPPDATKSADAASAKAGATGKRRGGEMPRVATVAAVGEDMPVLRTTIGTVISPASLLISSETQGLVTEILVGDGADVKKGEVLVRLDSRIAEANLAKDRAAYDRDRASLEHAQNVLKRQQLLVSSDAVSKQSLDDAVTAVETAEATLSLDQATIKGDEVTLAQKVILAPFDGRLGAFSVVVGSLVQPSATIVRLTSLDPLQASFTLSESDVGLVQSTLAKGGSVNVAATPLGTQDTYSGKVDFIDANVDAPSGSFGVRATIRNTNVRLFPGQSLAVTATLGTKPVIAVPSVAIQPSQSGTNVYVVAADGTIAVKPVTVALAAGDRSGLDSGLEAGDRVVVEGQVRLAAGMKVIDTSAPKVGDARPSAPVSDGKPAEKLASEAKPGDVQP